MSEVARPDAAVVLAGGGATRFGADKLAAPFGPVTVLEHLVAALGRLGVPAVVVGPDVGGGPVPATAAGLARLADTRPDVGLVAVLAGDQPFAAAALPDLASALRAHPDADAAVGVDGAGRDQHLLLVARTPALDRALGPAAPGTSMRSVLASLRLVRVPVGAAALDVDTPADLARARAQAGDGGAS